MIKDGRIFGIRSRPLRAFALRTSHFAFSNSLRTSSDLFSASGFSTYSLRLRSVLPSGPATSSTTFVPPRRPHHASSRCIEDSACNIRSSSRSAALSSQTRARIGLCHSRPPMFFQISVSIGISTYLALPCLALTPLPSAPNPSDLFSIFSAPFASRPRHDFVFFDLAPISPRHFGQLRVFDIFDILLSF